MFSQNELKEIKRRFEDRILSLRNDSCRAFMPATIGEQALGAAPFPITLYCMSMLDYFSGLYVGYSEMKKDKKRLNQVDRMGKFSERYLDYDFEVSRSILKVFRHLLVHTGEPLIVDRLYKTGIMGWMIANKTAKDNHWIIQSYNGSGGGAVHFAIDNFIEDLKNGILGEKGYFNDLSLESSLQDNYRNFYKELVTS